MRASASKTRSVDSSKITWKEYDKRPALMLAVESPAEATLAAKKWILVLWHLINTKSNKEERFFRLKQ